RTPTRSRPGHFQCNPASRIYKGSRGTSKGGKEPSIQIQSPSAILHHHPSIRITQPQIGCRVLPPPEGPNLSKTMRLVLSVLCYHLTCDMMTHHINCIAGNKHQQCAARSSLQALYKAIPALESPSMIPLPRSARLEHHIS